MMKKLSYKYYNKRITTRDNVNVRSHNQEESKFNIPWTLTMKLTNKNYKNLKNLIIVSAKLNWI